ncbi:hypothetical protein E1A91_A10G057300v1 [Gossypium mustelinum]|uniref:Uncharacterized protein n=1 Tax=Gossypium mustelinum TaxID=34275 RepID=A0A5D2XHP2_GOSMU|nr:hypothetical protein E1A91_A10G057300v1 [Gossypium mustelinum]
MGSSEGDSTFAPRTATGITRGGLPLFLLRTEVEDKAFAAHHNGREEKRPRSVRRNTPNSESEFHLAGVRRRKGLGRFVGAPQTVNRSFILQVSDAWKAGGWCPRRWWWCA